jgi:tRNA(Met) C34 N-acetyltransferase TmcA
VSLFVASHYKNTPNDLQMMSDAPAHHLFCLLGPTPPDSTSLPEVLCVIQVVMQFRFGTRNKKSITTVARILSACSRGPKLCMNLEENMATFTRNTAIKNLSI